MYILCRTHKSLINNSSPLRPISSATKALSYNIAKHIVKIWEPIRANKFTIENSFEFAKEVIEQDSGLFTVSLDVESLFTKITLEETTNISCDTLFDNEAKVNNSRETILKSFFWDWLYKTFSLILTVKSIKKLME